MRKSRILLADSHRVMLEGMRYLLEPIYEIVGMVDSADSMLKSAETLKPDLVVGDFSIAFSNQANTVRQLITWNPELKIIILSAYDDPPVMNEALDTGALGFVLLRTVAWDLIPAIKAALQDRTYVSPAVRWS